METFVGLSCIVSSLLLGLTIYWVKNINRQAENAVQVKTGSINLTFVAMHIVLLQMMFLIVAVDAKWCV